MKKRRARRKNRAEKEKADFSEAEEQFINLIAQLLVDITFKQAEHQRKKLSKISLKDSRRGSKPDNKKTN
jgi:hypothetical protein